MKIVSDTNIFLAVALEEESKSRIIEITDGCSLYAPEILYYEIGNALSAMIKRRQIETSDVQAIHSVTQQIPVSLAKVSIPKALEIAIEHNIYAYDVKAKKPKRSPFDIEGIESTVSKKQILAAVRESRKS